MVLSETVETVSRYELANKDWVLQWLNDEELDMLDAHYIILFIS